jgi:hypothetical protein
MLEGMLEKSRRMIALGRDDEAWDQTQPNGSVLLVENFDYIVGTDQEGKVKMTKVRLVLRTDDYQ